MSQQSQKKPQLAPVSQPFKGIINTKNYLQVQQVINPQTGEQNTKKSLFKNFVNYASERTYDLSKTILGDYTYKPKNTYPFQRKQKILAYLKAKYLRIVGDLDSATKIKFTHYDQDFFIKDYKDEQLRQVILKGKSQIEAAEEDLKQINLEKEIIQARFLNQVAYQFDKQRYTSIFWGLVFGAFICSTVYRGGSTARKAALFLAMGHAFGQISYHMNIDRYFDAVYSIYEIEAVKYALQQIKLENQERLHGKTLYID